MRIIWNERSLRWFRDASEYTGYNKKLAGLLLEHIPGGGTLCDIGCGAGLIDMELAPYMAHVTCVDISPVAIASVKESARRQGLGNVSALCADAEKLEGQWDTVIALFFGGYDFLSRFFPLAGDRLILVTHGEGKGNFGPEALKVAKGSNVKSVREYLDGLGVKYHLEETALEHGQPFADKKDAEDFVKAYSMPMTQAELDTYLAQRLEATGHEKFPLYLPNLKKFGLFVIRRNENEQLQRRA